MRRSHEGRTMPAATWFQGVLGFLAATASDNREQRIRERIAIKKGQKDKMRGGSRLSMRWFERRKRRNKIAKMSRKRNRQYV